MSQASFQGVLAPVLTPFRPDYEINSEAFLAHCRWLLDQGADGLAVFGTTSEANSLGLEERIALLDYVGRQRDRSRATDAGDRLLAP